MQDVVTILRVCPDDQFVVAHMTGHLEVKNFAAQVLANFDFGCVESDALANGLPTAETLDVEHHLESDGRFWTFRLYDAFSLVELV